MSNDSILKRLCEKGVNIPVPHSVEIDEDVNIDRISGDGVTLHSGSRIFGRDTLICKGCVIGREGPATIDNCRLGPDVAIKGGYVKNSVFLEKASVGYGSHVREGSILEEEASIAHCVGLKQTILFPFVTLGSLINFCDCLMAGGTSRKNHSEVGSSYIHFNFTPNQDKATPSLLGDVPRGVMLNNNPIFLGGQGGMVGPIFLNYGTVIAAGTLQRKDERDENRLLFGGALRPGNVRHSPGIYQNVSRIVEHNIRYIGNLIALDHWYRHVRSLFVSERFPDELLDGLIKTLSTAVTERVKRLKGLFENVSKTSERLLQAGSGHTPTLLNHQKLIMMWPDFEAGLQNLVTTDYGIETRRRFLEEIDSVRKKGDHDGCIDCIRHLSARQAGLGTQWLQGIVDHVMQTLHPLTGEL
ncbi:hypothetical protein JCM14469_03710 [Desulfatiferula olefinivorans]